MERGRSCRPYGGPGRLGAVLSWLWDIGGEVHLVRAVSGSGEEREGVESGEPLRSRRRRSFWAGMVGLAALVFVGIAAVLEMAPTAPTGPDAPPEAFSASRAMTHFDGDCG
jgi:hypothetical protein